MRRADLASVLSVERGAYGKPTLSRPLTPARLHGWVYARLLVSRLNTTLPTIRETFGRGHGSPTDQLHRELVAFFLSARSPVSDLDIAVLLGGSEESNTMLPTWRRRIMERAMRATPYDPDRTILDEVLMLRKVKVPRYKGKIESRKAESMRRLESFMETHSK